MRRYAGAKGMFRVIVVVAIVSLMLSLWLARAKQISAAAPEKKNPIFVMGDFKIGTSYYSSASRVTVICDSINGNVIYLVAPLETLYQTGFGMFVSKEPETCK